MKKVLEYEDFKKEVMATIKDHLSEEYQDYNMKFTTVKKSSGVEYEALMIGPKDKHSTVVPALNITEAYKQHQEGHERYPSQLQQERHVRL